MLLIILLLLGHFVQIVPFVNFLQTLSHDNFNLNNLCESQGLESVRSLVALPSKIKGHSLSSLNRIPSCSFRA